MDKMPPPGPRRPSRFAPSSGNASQIGENESLFRASADLRGPLSNFQPCPVTFENSPPAKRIVCCVVNITQQPLFPCCKYSSGFILTFHFEYMQSHQPSPELSIDSTGYQLLDDSIRSPYQFDLLSQAQSRMGYKPNCPQRQPACPPTERPTPMNRPTGAASSTTARCLGLTPEMPPSGGLLVAPSPKPVLHHDTVVKGQV
jgi:hypothetical protein